MKKLALGLILAVTLVACGGDKSVKQVKFDTWASVCTGYNNMLITLSPSVADGSMSDSGVAVLDEAKALVGPFCLGGIPVLDNTSSVTQQIQEVLLRMEGL